MDALRTAIGAADEEYLTALANKGLYKRALRELPEAGVAVELGESGLTATFGDGTAVTIAGSIPDYRCTCPSRSVCKHLLMAVLAARELWAAPAGGDGAAEPPPPPDFSPLAELNQGELEKLAGKKHFRAAVLAVQLGEGAAIEEGATLAITLADTGNTVRFLPGAPPRSAGCSCKSADFCAHRTQALVQYIAHKRGGLPAEFLPGDEEGPLVFASVALPYLRAMVTEVFATGLARLPESTADRFSQLGTICHGQRLAGAERLCARAAGRLREFTARSATFSRDLLIGDLCELLRLCDAIESGAADRETVGVFRETYRPVPVLDLWGLGAYGWKSTGGYTGVTTLFFCPGENRVLTYTASLPDTVQGDAEKIYAGGAPWGLPTKLSAIGHSRFSLRGGKLSGKGQLSASEAATATPQGAVDILDPALAPLRFDDFSLLLRALWQHLEAGEEEPLTAVLLPARWGAGDYDRVEQRWSLPLYDAAERRVDLSVRYEPATRLLLECLMEREEAGTLAGPLLARVSLREGRLTAYPITQYAPGNDGGRASGANASGANAPWNLGLDRPKKPKARKLNFDWGLF